MREQDIGHVLYGSYSHYVGNKGNRYRLILATSTPHTREHVKLILESIFVSINTHIGDELLIDVTENGTWSQPWHYPRKPANSTINDLYLEHLSGKGIEVPASFQPPSAAKPKVVQQHFLMKMKYPLLMLSTIKIL